MKRKSIVLWNPNRKLYSDVNKLDPKQYEILGQVIIDNVSDGISNIKKIPQDDLAKYSFDYILLPFEQFKNKREIIENSGVEYKKVFTFNEFWVKDCEEVIQGKYYGLWGAMHKAKIQMFKGKNILITGGSSGIGKACAEAFLLGGGNIIIAGRNSEKLLEVSKELSILGNINTIEWDIINISQGENKLAQCEKMVAGQMDILVNCAGVWEGKNFLDVTEEDFDIIMQTNLKATYFMCQLFAKYYIKNHMKGHIVNVISNVGNLPTVKPYGMSKWGLTGLTKGLGLNLAEYGITVNGIAPGAVATPLAGWAEGDCAARRNAKTGRLSFPCEVAHLILLLAGFFGENMPGEIMECDGGDKTIGMNL